MEKLLNADGTPSFLTISDLGKNFEESFARKQLGIAIKDIVVSAITNVDNNKVDCDEILSDNNIKDLIQNSINEVTDKCFTNQELNGSSYLGGIRKVITDYVGMESEYRQSVANAILSTETDKAKAGAKIFDLFSQEGFTNKDLGSRFISEIEISFGHESEDLVTEIGKEVGAAIAEADDKNLVINTTSKTIEEERENIKKELEVVDDDSEGNDDSDSGDTENNSDDGDNFDDSADDGSDPDDDGDTDDSDDGDNSTEETGEEDGDTAIIEDELRARLDSEIDAGKVSIGTPDVTINNVQEHEDSDHVGSETPDITPEPTVSDVSDAPNAENTTEPEMSEEDYKEYTNLMYSVENIGAVVVPLSPSRLDMKDIPSLKGLAQVYAKSTESLDNLQNAVSSRLEILKDIVDREHDEELSKKYEDYSKRAMEAFEAARDMKDTMSSIGITPYGLENCNDVDNIYIGHSAYNYLSGRFNKLKYRTPKKNWASVEDAIDAAFDIVLAKDKARHEKDKDILIYLANDRAGREDLFWQNILDLNTDDEKKNQIKNILQFGDLDIDKKIIVDDQYRKSVNLALETLKPKGNGKSENEINEDIFEKSKAKIEAILGRDINPDQEEIIRAMIEGRDTSDFAPTPFEKFLIKLGTDEVVKKNGGKDFEVGQESADLITKKAVVLCCLEKAVDKTKALSGNDLKDFKDYIYN